jgi:hypothetical protein
MIELFLEAMGSKQQALTYLNFLTGRNYTLPRFNEWLQGKRTPDKFAINAILTVVIEYAVKHNRINEIKL